MNSNGIGLGLVISKQIVEIFGGQITLKSRLGVGSEFTFTFKLENSCEQTLRRQSNFITFNSTKMEFMWKPKGLVSPSTRINYVFQINEELPEINLE